MSHPGSVQHGLRHRLQEKLEALAEENAALRETMGQGRVVEPDLADQASTASSHDWAMIRYRRNAVTLKEIEAALQSMDNDSYGFCELCGEAIAERRLLAMPSARYCVECQEMLDRNPEEFLPTGLGGGLRVAV